MVSPVYSNRGVAQVCPSIATAEGVQFQKNHISNMISDDVMVSLPLCESGRVYGVCGLAGLWQ